MTRHSAAQIVDSLQTAGVHLGDLVFYRLWEATSPRERVLHIAGEVGFPEDLVPKGMDDDAAWTRAMRLVHEEGYLIRPVAKDAEHITWAVVAETADTTNNDLEYATTSRMTLHRKTGKRLYENRAHPVCKRVDSKFLELRGSVTTDQIRSTMKRICKDNEGIPIGTEWFVPGNHAQLLRSMRDLVNRLGGSEVWLLPVHDTADTRDTLTGAFRSTMADELAALKREIEDFDETSRIDTLERRLETFESLRSRAALYEGMLEVAHDDLDKTIQRLQRKVSKMLGVKTKAKEAKAKNKK